MLLNRQLSISAGPGFGSCKRTARLFDWQSHYSCMYTFYQIGFGFCVLRRLKMFCLSFEITASKSAIVHLVCVIIMHTIYEVYKDVASSCSSYAHLSRTPRQFVVAGDVKRSAGGGSITTHWNGYSATYQTGVWHTLANNFIFSPACILGQLPLSV